MSGDEVAEEVRRTMTRAIRRLSWMEYGLFAVNGVLAMLGGAVGAWGIEAATGLAFRPTWMVCSLLLFVIPGVIVFGRDRKVYGARQGEPKDTNPNDDENDDDG